MNVGIILKQAEVELTVIIFSIGAWEKKVKVQQVRAFCYIYNYGYIINYSRLKAVVYTTYGGAEVLQLKEIDKPVPEDDEVLIKVHAVSLNDWDLGLLKGDLINRMMYGWMRPKKNTFFYATAERATR